MITRFTKVRLPRALLLWWSLWLLASWLMVFGVSALLSPTPQTYGTGLQQILVSISMGMVIVWPMFRFSAQPKTSPRVVAFVDWVAICGTLQVVLWPMRLSGQWAPMRILLLDLSFCGWALIVSGIVAWGLGGSMSTLSIRVAFSQGTSWQRGVDSARRIRRQAGFMLICLTLAMLGPLLWVIVKWASIGDGAEFLFWSPISCIWLLTESMLQEPSNTEWLRGWLVLSVGVLVWIATAMRAHEESTSLKKFRSTQAYMGIDDEDDSGRVDESLGLSARPIFQVRSAIIESLLGSTTEMMYQDPDDQSRPIARKLQSNNTPAQSATPRKDTNGESHDTSQ